MPIRRIQKLQTTVSVRTLIPNTYMLTKSDGIRAMITIAMILVVSTLLTI